jgi:hypothetical protein
LATFCTNNTSSHRKLQEWNPTHVSFRAGLHPARDDADVGQWVGCLEKVANWAASQQESMEFSVQFPRGGTPIVTLNREHGLQFFHGVDYNGSVPDDQLVSLGRLLLESFKHERFPHGSRRNE